MVLPEIRLLLPVLPAVVTAVVEFESTIPTELASVVLVEAIPMVLLVMVLLSAPFCRWIPQPYVVPVVWMLKSLKVMKSAPSRRTTARSEVVGAAVMTLLLPLKVTLLVALVQGMFGITICSL